MKPTSQTVRQKSNQQARHTWENKAVGSQRAHSPASTLSYFEEIRNYRYGYETPFIPQFFDFSGLSSQRVLEIGVGNGIDALEMIRGGAIYTGVDITHNHINLTRRYINLIGTQNLPGDVEDIVEGDLLEQSLPGDYDVVYSFGVLHHIAHEEEFLNRIFNLLRPGGELRVAFYSRFSFFNVWLIITWLTRNKMRNPLSDWQSHVAEGSPLGNPVVIKIRSKDEIQKLLEKSGFEIIRYGKKGFVQRYLPFIGRFLAPNGKILNGFARYLGWYHCFVCRRP